MGIHNLNQILQKYAPNCYQTIHLSELSEKKIAVDISLYFYKYKSSSGERWIENFLGMIQCLRKWNIHPVFIYDGKAPQEKFIEQARRRQSRDKQEEKIQLLQDQIEDYEKNGVIGDLLGEICYVDYIKIPSLFRKEKKDEGDNKKKFNLQLAKDKVSFLKNGVVHVTEEDVERSKQLFDILSIPYLQAPFEAECFASHLCVYGFVDAVLSEDTDVMVYQTPLSISKLDTVNNTVVQINYGEMIEELGFTSNMFTDMCIMCSCDYNSNIPLIGPEKSYSLIKEHRSIDHIFDVLRSIKQKDGRSKYDEADFSKLNHVRCRELFTTSREQIDMVDLPCLYTGEPDFTQLEEFCRKNNVRYTLDRLVKCMKCVEVDFIEEEKKEDTNEEVPTDT